MMLPIIAAAVHAGAILRGRMGDGKIIPRLLARTSIAAFPSAAAHRGARNDNAVAPGVGALALRPARVLSARNYEMKC